MYSFYMPVSYNFGENCFNKSYQIIKSFGKKAFIVTGKTSAEKSGALKDVLNALNELSISYYHFNETKENPTVKSVVDGTRLFQENQCDFVIAIGGGSPIDAAKAISVSAANNFTSSEFFNTANIKSAYPIVAIPTTSGTGTEVTPYSVITDTEKMEKIGFGSPKIYPKLSFLDPVYTVSLPVKVTRDTAIDAISHLLEGLYSKKRNPTVYPLIYEGIKLIYDSLEETLKDPEDIDLRTKLMTASLWGGIVIAQTGTTLQHAIGYPVTTKLGASHGLANGIFMKDIMKLFYPHLKSEIDGLFEHIGISRTDFYNWIDNLLKEEKINISEDFINRETQTVLNTKNMLINPCEVNAEDIKRIYAVWL